MGMTINDGPCAGDEFDNEMETTSSSDLSVTAIMAVLALAFAATIVSLVCVCCAWRRRRRSLKTRQQIPKEEDVQDGPHKGADSALHEQTSPLSQNVDGHAHDLNEVIEIEVDLQTQTLAGGTTKSMYV